MVRIKMCNEGLSVSSDNRHLGGGGGAGQLVDVSPARAVVDRVLATTLSLTQLSAFDSLFFGRDATVYDRLAQPGLFGLYQSLFEACETEASHAAAAAGISREELSIALSRALVERVSRDLSDVELSDIQQAFDEKLHQVVCPPRPPVVQQSIDWLRLKVLYMSSLAEAQLAGIPQVEKQRKFWEHMGDDAAQVKFGERGCLDHDDDGFTHSPSAKLAIAESQGAINTLADLMIDMLRQQKQARAEQAAAVQQVQNGVKRRGQARRPGAISAAVAAQSGQGAVDSGWASGQAYTEYESIMRCYELRNLPAIRSLTALSLDSRMTHVLPRTTLKYFKSYIRQALLQAVSERAEPEGLEYEGLNVNRLIETLANKANTKQTFLREGAYASGGKALTDGQVARIRHFRSELQASNVPVVNAGDEEAVIDDLPFVTPFVAKDKDGKDSALLTGLLNQLGLADKVVVEDRLERFCAMIKQGFAFKAAPAQPTRQIYYLEESRLLEVFLSQRSAQWYRQNREKLARLLGGDIRILAVLAKHEQQLAQHPEQSITFTTTMPQFMARQLVEELSRLTPDKKRSYLAAHRKFFAEYLDREVISADVLRDAADFVAEKQKAPHKANLQGWNRLSLGIGAGTGTVTGLAIAAVVATVSAALLAAAWPVALIGGIVGLVVGVISAVITRTVKKNQYQQRVQQFETGLNEFTDQLGITTPMPPRRPMTKSTREKMIARGKATNLLRQFSSTFGKETEEKQLDDGEGVAAAVETKAGRSKSTDQRPIGVQAQRKPARSFGDRPSLLNTSMLAKARRHGAGPTVDRAPRRSRTLSTCSRDSRN